MSNFIYYEKLEDYEEQVKKAKLCDEKDKEIERLQKENNDLRKLYQRTYKHLFEKGNDELASYFQAQIDECPTFYVEPIIDYYEETKRLNNIINELEKWAKEELEQPNWASCGARCMLDKLQELKGSDKE